MRNTWIQDGRVAKLRCELEQAVRETGSLTHKRVLRLSSALDQAILMYFEAQAGEQESNAGGTSGAL